MAWTTLNFSVGQILTAAQMNQVQDNFTALAQGLSGAPQILAAALAANSVGQSEIASGAVHQAELSTTVGEVNIATTGSVVLPGGTYGFYPQVRQSSANQLVANISNEATTSWSAYRTNITLSDAGAAGTVYAQQRYVNASPPYDIGDGEVALFIFAALNAVGEVVATYEAQEAPWHYNGPTDIRADFYSKDGAPFRRRRDMSGFADTWNTALTSGDPSRIRDYLDAFAAAEDYDEEITQDIKNADMSMIPHPFTTPPPATTDIVMLDNVDAMAFELRDRKIHDNVSICELLNDGHLIVQNMALPNRAAPVGVPVHSIKWKNAGG
jgi:hypothetical protein